MRKNIISIVLLLSILIIPSVLFAQPAGVGTSNPQGSSDLNIPSVGLPDPGQGVKGILINFLRWLLGIFGVIALASFVIAGFQYFLARGDEGAMKTAKQNVVYSVIGVLIALAGVIVIRAVDTALRAENLRF